MKPRLLVLDDEPRMAEVTAIVLRAAGHEVETFTDAHDALAAIDARPFDLLLTDLRMDPLDGIEVLKRARALSPDLPVILVTAYATVKTAIQALREGAFDYVQKPFDNTELRQTVARALSVTRLARENRYLRAELRAGSAPDGIPADVIAHAPSMRRAIDLARRAARGRSAVLITGESGTGKEVLARLVHYFSERVGRAFVAANCKAFSEGVLESELFGHVKGAFTGATRQKPGLFQRAHEGTLLLDEIGETSPDFQAKLLRVLQERTVRPVGADREVPVDVRVVAATNRDLTEEVRSGRFREDLFFRLCVIPIELPPLRERPEDVLPLARFFLGRWSAELGREVTGWSAAVEDHFLRHPWPGNVRELENAIERGVVLAEGPELELHDVVAGAHLPQSSDAAGTAIPPVLPPPDALEPLASVIDRATAQHLDTVLAACGGVRSEAARRLGVDRTTLYRLMKKLGIDG